MSTDTHIETVKTKQYLGPILLTALPAIIIALCIMFLGFIVHKGGMNLFGLTSAIYDGYYPIILATYLIVLPLFFPFTLKLLKNNKISLFQKLTSKKTILTDITFGILAGISSYIFFFLDVHVMLKMPVEKTGNIQLVILEIVSLVFISGFFKEIYFRGIPYYLLKDKFGEWKTFLFGNICFTILDWPNFGLSFFLGLIWYLFFRKRGSLIIPVIGHGLCNLLGILARVGAFSFIGITPL
jgi:membrane protease YdiL (CAAX protease family)